MKRLAAAAALGLCACSRSASDDPGAPLQNLRQFVLTETRHGVTQWVLHAEEATMRDAGGADLSKPEIDVYQDGKPTSRIKSKEGVYDDATRNLHLRGDVVVATPGDRPAETTTLKTDALDYLDEEKHFKTDRPVVIERKGSVMRGRGLVASHDLSEIHVLHQEATFR